ncbi:MAG: hypothetical protein V2I54_09115 [Bacteroidales bacterium]|jgi:tetratricopeptide (TPR) repeat protein|nr:hypothetical protein [Bacteroidales bacterium]
MRIICILFLCMISLRAYPQPHILSDPEATKEIEVHLNRIYNYEFDSFESYHQKLLNQYPDHPLPYLFYAIKIYWEHFPVTPQSNQHSLYVNQITRSIEKSDKLLELDEQNTEAVFISLMSRLLLMQYYADNHQSSKVIPYVRKTYQLTRKGFNLTEEFTDFNFSTGLYNYYIEAYPEKHPVYKPVAYFFPGGDIHFGLTQLEHTWKKGIFLDAEALSFLVYISLNFEADYQKSNRFTRALHHEYPNNPLYLSYRITNLFLLERYQRAETLVDKLDNSPYLNDFFRMMVHIYRGMILEKKYHQYPEAEKHYRQAIHLSDSYVPFANGRLSFAYFGLARIYQTSDPEKAKTYRTIAKELSAYKHLTFD